MKFNLKDYEGKKVVMHCGTEAEAKSFCEFLDRAGRRWFSGERYTNTNYFKKHKEETYYDFNEGVYEQKEYFETCPSTYTILEWSDFEKDTPIPNFSKSDLRNKDVILRRNGEVEIVNDDILIAQKGWNDLDNISNDLTSLHSFCEGQNEWDIIAVRRPLEKGECQFDAFKYGHGRYVFDGNRNRKMTIEEVCKTLGKKIKIIETREKPEKKKFVLQDYENKQVVMHCKTKEEAESLCEFLCKHGKHWANGKSYLFDTNFCFEDRSCYNFNHGFISSRKYYEGRGFTVLEWSDFSDSVFTKSDLKDGDVVLRRNGKIQIVCAETQILLSESNWHTFDELNDDLTSNISSSHDIVAVRRLNKKEGLQFEAFRENMGTLVYEKTEEVEMTLNEIYDELGEKVEIITSEE